jgi:ubiquitin carboxyl-terminal hydrolase 1
MASLSYLQPHLDNIYAKAETYDVSTPVLDALVAQLHGLWFILCFCHLLIHLIALNSPSSRHTSLRPTEIIHALSTPTPGFKRGTLFASREHQDAQELFQLITETLKEEALEVDKEANKDRGLSGLGSSHTVYLHRPAREPGKGVFEGLTANRRSCVVCGYTEAVMHFAFDNLQLSVPRALRCSLAECLEDYTRMEILTDCICRRCSMLMTFRRLEADLLKVSTPIDGPETPSRKKRIKEAKKHLARVKAALDEGRIEEDIKGVTLDKVISKSSTKQTMLARVLNFVWSVRFCVDVLLDTPSPSVAHEQIRIYGSLCLQEFVQCRLSRNFGPNAVYDLWRAFYSTQSTHLYAFSTAFTDSLFHSNTISLFHTAGTIPALCCCVSLRWPFVWALCRL